MRHLMGMKDSPFQVILITGLSGSGKTVALHALEDLGYFSIDNLPLTFVFSVVNTLADRGEAKVALTIDARNKEPMSELAPLLQQCAKKNWFVRVLYLECSHEALVRRFSESRRPHPLARGKLTLDDCIEEERHLLENVVDVAQRLDTSGMQPRFMREWLKSFSQGDPIQLTVFLQSFGFKHGAPLSADFVFDSRCLPNPHYDAALRELTGLDKPVQLFLDQQPLAQELFQDLMGWLERWVPHFAHDQRKSLTVAIGCTGGQHRSVYLVERLAREWRGDSPVRVQHRDLEKALRS